MNPPKKTGRNEPCPCGSGKKFKKCCLASDDQNPVADIGQHLPQRVDDEGRELRKHPRCWINGCPREIGEACICDPDGAWLCVQMLLGRERQDSAKALAAEYDMRLVHGEDAFLRLRNLESGVAEGVDFGPSWAAAGVSLGVTANDLCKRYDLALRDVGFSILDMTFKDDVPRGFEALTGDIPEGDENMKAIIMPKPPSSRVQPIHDTLTIVRVEGRLIDLSANKDAPPLLVATRRCIPGLSVGDSVKVGLHENDSRNGPLMMNGIPGEPRCMIAFLGRK